MKKTIAIIVAIAIFITLAISFASCEINAEPFFTFSSPKVTGLESSEGLRYELMQDLSSYAVVVNNRVFPGKELIIDTHNHIAVSVIDKGAFSSNNIEMLIIGNNVKIIGSLAFADCTSLKNVSLGNGITLIDGSAFYKCESLTSVVIPDSTTCIGSYAFSDCHSLESITIGSGITSIKRGTFSNCDLLETVVIPDSVTSIGEYAFYSCDSLTTLTIGKGVTDIAGTAFSLCPNISNITVHRDNSEYLSIDGNLYSKDGTTLIKYAAGKTDTEFILPEGVTTIGDYAFDGATHLKSIVIPTSVNRIEPEAFTNCESLTAIKYRGSQFQWSAIDIPVGIIPVTKYTIIYNYRG